MYPLLLGHHLANYFNCSSITLAQSFFLCILGIYSFLLFWLNIWIYSFIQIILSFIKSITKSFHVPPSNVRMSPECTRIPGFIFSLTLHVFTSCNWAFYATLSHILALSFSLFLSDWGVVWVTPCCYHDDPRDPGGCPVQCGPAGGAAPPGPAAMHWTPPLLYYVPGTHSHTLSPPPTITQSCSAIFNIPLSRFSLSFCRQILTPTLKTGMHLWLASPVI